MQQLFAIAGLTWKAAFRFKLFLVITVLLLTAVVGLPLLIKDDGTARGFTQILLTYTLSTITALLGLSTLWLACGTLARDIEECQMQVVATKPVARWQIWLGKWLGIVTLNAALLLISGTSVYALLEWRATKLPEKERHILQNEIFVARGSAKEKSYEPEINAEVERVLRERVEKTKVTPSQADLDEARKQIRDQMKAGLQVVAPGGGYRPWQIDLGNAKNYLRDKPLYLRIKFNAAQSSPSGTFAAWWIVGKPETPQARRLPQMSLSPDSFHEFEIPPNLFDESGVLTIVFINPNNTALLFPLEDGMEVLYREGGFALNFARGLAIILCWMALLASFGLAAASFLSFPVAAFASLGLLAVVMSAGTLSNVVSEGRYLDYGGESGPSVQTAADKFVVQIFRGMLVVIDLAKDFSPIDSLSAGRSISWLQLLRAFGQIVVLLGGTISAFGIFAFSRRELATAQGTQ